MGSTMTCVTCACSGAVRKRLYVQHCHAIALMIIMACVLPVHVCNDVGLPIP
jgi:hypothetical protein